MGRIGTIVGIIALVIGLGAGYVWWGRPLDRVRTELADTRGRVEALEKQATPPAPTARPDEVAGLQARIKELEAELEQGRQMRARLQDIISQGRK